MKAVQMAEFEKHENYGSKCEELGWRCVPMAVNTYGVWGKESEKVFKKVATRLSIQKT